MTVDFDVNADTVSWIRERLEELSGCNIGDVGIDESLIGTGIDSLTMMRFAAEFQAAGIEIGFADLLSQPTLRGWEDLLRNRIDVAPTGRGAADIDVTPSSRPFPLTPVQHAYWIGRREAVEMGGVGCHAYFEFRCADIDPVRLGRAVEDLKSRHEMLRAVFTDDGMQHILPARDLQSYLVENLREMPSERIEEHLAATRDSLSHRVLDAGAGEVFGVRLLRLPDCRSRLVIDIDLLVADVLSVQIVLSDLASLYARPEVALPEIGVSFSTYVAQRARRGSSDRSAAYWHERIPEIPRAPALPLAKQPGQIDLPRFVRRSARLTNEQWQTLRVRAQAAGVTPSIAVATAFAHILARWSRQPRLLLNLPIFDRRSNHPDIPLVVADFTDLVLLDVDLSDGVSFAAQARAAQQRFQDNAAHTDYSGVDVLRDLTRFHQEPFTAPVVFASNIGRDLVDQVFRDELGELDWMVSQTPQCWLDHQLYDDEDGLEIVWDAVEELFPPHMLDDMFDSYIGVLEHLASDDETWDAPVHTDLPARQLRMRRQANATESPLPASLLHAPVFDRAELIPDAAAVICGDRILSFRELTSRAMRVAEVLRANGCSVGDRIGILSDKGWEQVVSALGVLAAGGVYVPLGPEQPPARRDTILADAGITQILTQSWLPMVDISMRERLPVHDVDLLAPAENSTTLENGATPDDVAYVIYTSGSTGMPKGVAISHRSALNTVSDINRRYEVDHSDRGIGLAGLGFDLSVYDIFGLLAAGAALVLPSPDRRGDPSHWADLIDTHSITVWNSVPAQMVILDEFLADSPDPHAASLRLALLSGDWIPVSLPDSVRRSIPGLALHSLGGATEAAIWSIAYEVGEVDPNWRSIPYGKPLANQTFHVLDTHLGDSPEWVPGELFIGGLGLAQGYIGDPVRTSERFIVHPGSGERLYRTGDLGRYLPDGTIEFLGRIDSQVKIRGHRIEPGEIEAAVERHPDIGQARVVVDGTDPLDRHLHAFVTAARCESPRSGALAPAYASLRGASATTPAMDGVGAYSRVLEKAVYLSIARSLERLAPGVLGGAAPGITAEEFADRARVDPRHRRLLRRWLAAAHRTGHLHRDERIGRYHGLIAPSDREVETAWLSALESPDTRLWPEPVIRLFHTSANQLEALMRGEVDQVHLLFSDGDSSTAVAAFTESAITRYLNATVAAVVGDLASRHTGDSPFRILEIGAGVGGTTVGALKAVAPYHVEYLFTDVSPYFLDEAVAKFGSQDRVHYSLYDMEIDPWSQGLRTNSFDAIIAANVLHNTRDVRELLGRTRELLTAGGSLILTELTEEIPEMLISMEFLAGAADHGGAFTDDRADTDSFIFSSAEWATLLEQAGGSDIVVLPPPASSMAGLGQELLVATFKSDRRRVCMDSVFDHLAEQLPTPMVPERIEVLDAIPLTSNGKVDRATLISYVRAGPDRPEGDSFTPPVGALETSICGVWADCLSIPAVSRDQDFFAVGGDSLLAARLASRMIAEIPELGEVGFDTILRFLMNRETVAAIAVAVGSTGQER